MEISEDLPLPNHLSETTKAHYDALLWQRAGELSRIRTPLTQRQMELFEEVAAMRSRRLNLHEQDLMSQKEEEYWRICRKVQDIISQEDRLIGGLDALEKGTIDEPALQRLAPPNIEETTQISSRKQKIMEEKVKLGIDPREIAWDMYTEFGSGARNLTTGRNRRNLKGSFDSYSAPGEFFSATADTHGGKVSHGKNGSYFTGPSGRRIRKI